MKTVLLTGFEPWGAHTSNSSWEILKDLRIGLPTGWQCKVRQLPVSWTAAPSTLAPLLTQDVKATVCFGMNESDSRVLVERIAINLTGPGLKDGHGRCCESEHVIDGAPPAYWTGLPVKSLTTALSEQGIPCGESQSAGAYLCNFTFYWLMHFIAQERPDMVGGFIHVPKIDDNSTLHSAVPTIVQAVISATACQ